MMMMMMVLIRSSDVITRYLYSIWNDTDIMCFVCFSVCSCALGFIIGLLFTQRSGNYFVTMFDDYSATLPLVIVVIFETVSVAWVYGTDR